MTDGATSGSSSSSKAKPRRQRDRDGTEAELLAAARRLLDRNGVLAGLNLQEVSKEAGVNRGLIYQYFGSRRELLRAALSETRWVQESSFKKVRSLPFGKRRIRVFEQSLERGDFLRLMTLLILDGDENAPVLPALDEALHDLERDIEQGELAADDDALVMHAMTIATYFGYAVVRDVVATKTQIPVKELDQRARVVFSKMVQGLRGPNADGTVDLTADKT